MFEQVFFAACPSSRLCPAVPLIRAELIPRTAISAHRHSYSFSILMDPVLAAMDANFDFAQLDADELRWSLAAALAENRRLESVIKTLSKICAERDAMGCRKCGPNGNDSRRGGSEIDASPDIPVLPNEIFLSIAMYFKEDSRSLLNLARSCRGLYELLPPRLCESFSVDFDPKVVVFAKETGPGICLPRGREFVKHLDVRRNALWRQRDADYQRQLILSCPIRLHLDWRTFRRISSYYSAYK